VRKRPRASRRIAVCVVHSLSIHPDESVTVPVPVITSRS
jgi:hypothetical protein